MNVVTPHRAWDKRFTRAERCHLPPRLPATDTPCNTDLQLRAAWTLINIVCLFFPMVCIMCVFPYAPLRLCVWEQEPQLVCPLLCPRGSGSPVLVEGAYFKYQTNSWTPAADHMRRYDPKCTVITPRLTSSQTASEQERSSQRPRNDFYLERTQ